jgi:protein-disulfide isomerase
MNENMNEENKDFSPEGPFVSEAFASEPDAAVVPTRKDRFLAISILVGALVVGGSVVFAAVYRGNGSPVAAQTPTSTAAVVQPPTPAATSILSLGPRDAILGNQDATVTVIEYGDYQCPFCTRYFSQVQPQIMSQYIKTGKVKMVFRNFAFLDRFPGVPAGENESHDAAAAAECAEDQSQLWAYHDALYAAKVGDEAKGGSEDDGFFNRALFLSLAKKIKLDMPTFTSCIDSKKYAPLVDQEYSDGVKAGVNSTPVTFVDGKMVQTLDPQTNQYESAGADQSAIFQAIQDAVSGK